jgi:hypothetical protein
MAGKDSWGRARYKKGGRGFKGLFSIDFIRAFNILSISAISFIDVPNSPLQLKLNPLLVISEVPIRKQNDKIC